MAEEQKKQLIDAAELLQKMNQQQREIVLAYGEGLAQGMQMAAAGQSMNDE